MTDEQFQEMMAQTKALEQSGNHEEAFSPIEESDKIGDLQVFVTPDAEKMMEFHGLPVDYGATLSYSYLRFYEDGTVIESSIRGERSPEIMSWFDKSDGSVSNGTCEVDSNSLQFSVTSDSGSVDYTGRIVDAELHLHSFSRI